VILYHLVGEMGERLEREETRGREMSGDTRGDIEIWVRRWETKKGKVRGERLFIEYEASGLMYEGRQAGMITV